MFLRRTGPRGPERFLVLRVRLFFAGAVLLLAGMALDRRLLLAAAVAVLLVAFGLGLADRYAARRQEPPPE